MICSSCWKDIPFSGFALGASGATIGYLFDGFW